MTHIIAHGWLQEAKCHAMFRASYFMKQVHTNSIKYDVNMFTFRGSVEVGGDVRFASSLTTFRQKLKTHLFRQFYADIVL